MASQPAPPTPPTPATPATPYDVQIKVEEMRATAETTRQQTLARLAQGAQDDAAAYQGLRDDLAKTLPPDDPRLAALDTRILGTQKVIELAGGAGGGPAALPDWVVKGQVLDSRQRPVAGAKVALATGDEALSAAFGEVQTAADGSFEVHVGGDPLRQILTRAPQARVVAASPDGQLIATTQEITPASGVTETLVIHLGLGKKAPRLRKRPAKPAKPVKKPRKRQSRAAERAEEEREERQRAGEERKEKRAGEEREGQKVDAQERAEEERVDAEAPGEES